MLDGYIVRNYRERLQLKQRILHRERIKCLKLNYTLKCSFKKFKIFLPNLNLGGDTGDLKSQKQDMLKERERERAAVAALFVCY